MATTDQPKGPQPRRPQAPSSESRTIIGKDVIVTGEITGNGDVEVRGTLSGAIKLKNNVATVSKTGVAQASIAAKNVEICGRLDGDVIAEELVIIRKDSVLTGNVKAKRVNLEDGAQFKGSVDMHSVADAPSPAEPAPTQQRPAAQPQQRPAGQRPAEPSATPRQSDGTSTSPGPR